MPGMPRQSNKMTKIAFKILGLPSNACKERGNKELERRERIQKTYRIR